MNGTQITSAVTPLIAFFAGLLAGKGVFGLDAMAWTTILGAVVAFGTAIWGVFVTRKTAMVSAVAAMPEVKSVTLDPAVSNSVNVAGSTPANVTIGAK